MNARLLVLSSAVTLAVTFFQGFAQADDSAAEALYQEGLRAAQAKDWALACTKFKESHGREPAPGTLLNLADCEENRGKLLDALAHFDAAARLFRPRDERTPYAKERAVALERRIPKLTLRLNPSAPTGTVVERDGVTVDVASLGRAVRVDPGEHAIVVRAPGRVETSESVRLAEGEAREMVVAPGEPRASQETRVAPVSEQTDRSGALRTAGIVSLGVGAVGVGVGLLGGLLTLNAKSAADAHCAAGCDPEGLDAESRGKTWSAVATGGFIVGGVGLAAGAGLLLLAPSRAPASTVTAGPVPGGGAALRWGGTF